MGNLSPGSVTEPHIHEIQRLLGECWHEFEGSDAEKMHGGKIQGRAIEDVSWKSPRLQFTIERHGATVMGSTLAELHRWTVDLDKMTADCEPQHARRRVEPVASKLDVNPVADEVAEAVQKGEDAPFLKWNPTRNRVKIKVGEIDLKTSYKQTLQSRRKRLRIALQEKMEKLGWGEIGLHVYSREKLKPKV